LFLDSRNPAVSPATTPPCLAALVHAMSKHAGTSKWVTPHDPTLEKVPGYLQKGLNDIKSESECAIESDHNVLRQSDKMTKLLLKHFHNFLV
jgi:hypothetical protein